MVECELSIPPFQLPVDLRFNRYMVECESKNNQSVTVTDTVLIDTWWNVNIACNFPSINFAWF